MDATATLSTDHGACYLEEGEAFAQLSQARPHLQFSDVLVVGALVAIGGGEHSIAPGLYFNGSRASMSGQPIPIRRDAQRIARSIARCLSNQPDRAHTRKTS